MHADVFVVIYQRFTVENVTNFAHQYSVYLFIFLAVTCGWCVRALGELKTGSFVHIWFLCVQFGNIAPFDVPQLATDRLIMHAIRFGIECVHIHTSKKTLNECLLAEVYLGLNTEQNNAEESLSSYRRKNGRPICWSFGVNS